MVKPKLVATAGHAPQRSKSERTEHALDLALHASYEIEQLSALLSKPEVTQHADTFVYVARGLGRRIHQLNGIIMSAIGESEIPESDIRTFERELYG
jgi:hypothetical protein